MGSTSDSWSNRPLDIEELLVVSKIACPAGHARAGVACKAVTNESADGPSFLPGMCVARIRAALGAERWR